MEDDVPSELTPGEQARRQEADRVWGWRKFDEQFRNQKRLEIWWTRWIEFHPALWALGRPRLNQVYSPRWKWQM